MCYHLYSLIQLNRANTTNKLYNLSHYWDTAELSPLSDMSDAIHAQTICTFIINSAVHCDRHCSLAINFWGNRRKITLTCLFSLTTMYGFKFYWGFLFVMLAAKFTGNSLICSEDGCTYAVSFMFCKPPLCYLLYWSLVCSSNPQVSIGHVYAPVSPITSPSYWPGSLHICVVGQLWGASVRPPFLRDMESLWEEAINWLEMEMVYCVGHQFWNLIWHCLVLVRCDNTTVVAYLS